MLVLLYGGNDKLLPEGVKFCEANTPGQPMPCQEFEDYTLFYITAIFFGYVSCGVRQGGVSAVESVQGYDKVVFRRLGLSKDMTRWCFGG